MTTELPVTSTSNSNCQCGESHSGDPVLDARSIPHAIRHAAIFGALDSLTPGAAIELIAPHEPLPLLAQIREAHGESIQISYLEEGPEAWTLKLARA